MCQYCRSQWPLSKGVSLLLFTCWESGFESRRGMALCRECFVLYVTGLCDGLITRPEDSYRLRVSECDLGTS